MDATPHKLRLRAEHYRQLADSQVDERVRSILRTMAEEIETQARELAFEYR